MALPYARSIAEEHLYMRLHPCACGAVSRTARRHSTGAIAQGITSVHEFVCPGCGAERRFAFQMPDLMPRHADMYGGPDPSRIIDAGEWRVVALQAMERGEQLGRRSGESGKLVNRGDEPLALRRAFEESLAAYQEILKFFPPGSDKVPDSAFFTERGRRIRAQEPSVAFTRSFVNAMIEGVRSNLTAVQ